MRSRPFSGRTSPSPRWPNFSPRARTSSSGRTPTFSLASFKTLVTRMETPLRRGFLFAHRVTGAAVSTFSRGPEGNQRCDLCPFLNAARGRD